MPEVDIIYADQDPDNAKRYIGYTVITTIISVAIGTILLFVQLKPITPKLTTSTELNPCSYSDFNINPKS